MVKKKLYDILSRFYMIPERHGQTDGQIAISISSICVKNATPPTVR